MTLQSLRGFPASIVPLGLSFTTGIAADGGVNGVGDTPGPLRTSFLLIFRNTRSRSVALAFRF